MKQLRPSYQSLFFVVILLFAPFLARPMAAQLTPQFAPREVVFGLRRGAVSVKSWRQVTSLGMAMQYQPALHAVRMKLRPGVNISEVLARLRQRGDVLFAEPNYIFHALVTPNDPLYITRQYGPQKVQANFAWDLYQPQTDVTVAIIDTGVQYDHPDLVNNLARDAEGNVIGFNLLNGTNDARDDNGHGTHCAGIAAAQTNNGIGIAGIAGPEGTVKIMPVKVLDWSGSGTAVDVANGIVWAVDNGAKVISLSLGSTSSSILLDNAVQYAWSKGAVIVAAAGNTGNTAKVYPAAYEHVISVAATDSTDKLASYSTRGAWVKTAAPGSSIYSTYPTSRYVSLSGTSMACPHVAAEAALLLSQNPSLSNADVSNLILTNVDPYTPSGSLAIGAGRINVYRALQVASGYTPTPPPAPTGLTAIAGDARVSLSWYDTAGATGYTIKRRLSNESEYTVIATGITSTQFTDTSVLNGVTYFYVISAYNTLGEGPNSTEVSATPSYILRINSGGSSLTTTIGTFIGDKYYSGGSKTTRSSSLIIANTSAPALYRSLRYGTSFKYTLPAAPGNYILKLHFAETASSSSAANRLFSVTVNGITVLSNYHVLTAAGGYNTAVVESFPISITGSGGVTIQFQASSSSAFINAIELVSVIP